MRIAAENSGELQTPRQTPELPQVEVAPDLVADAWAKYHEQNEWLGKLLSGRASPAEVSLATVSMGQSLMQIAELEYGAPNNDEFNKALEDFDQEIIRLVGAANAEYEAELAWFDNKLTQYTPADGSQSGAFSRDKARIAWFEHNPQEFEEAYDRLNSLVKRTDRLKGDLRIKRLEMHDEFIAQRSEAYRQTLQAAGVKMFDPATSPELETHRTSAKVKKVMSEVLQDVPESWVRASNIHAKNTGRQLRVWESKRRAHYMSHKRTKTSTKAADMYVVTIYDGDAPEPGTYDYYRYTKTPPKNAPEWVRNEGELPAHSNDYYRMNIEFYNSWRHRSRDGKPAGSGWIEAEVDGEKTWYRHKMREDSSSFFSEAHITIPLRSESNNEVKSTALHEFSHRAEESLPDVYRIGNAFLAYRAQDADGVMERAQHIPGHRRDEKGYRDNFFIPYMGKVYPSDHTEIVSMGMESLWYGSHGGFTGQAQDPEYEALIMGLLAHTGTN